MRLLQLLAICLNVSLWCCAFGRSSDGQLAVLPAATTTAASLDRLLFLVSEDGSVAAVDADSGAQQWTFDSKQPLTLRLVEPAVGLPALLPLDTDTDSDDDDDERLASSQRLRDFEDSLIGLKVSIPELVARTPFVDEHGTLFLGQKTTKLFVVDARTGRVRHELNSADGDPLLTAATAADVVYFGRADYLLSIFDQSTGSYFNVSFAELQPTAVPLPAGLPALSSSSSSSSSSLSSSTALALLPRLDALSFHSALPSAVDVGVVAVYAPHPLLPGSRRLLWTSENYASLAGADKLNRDALRWSPQLLDAAASPLALIDYTVPPRDFPAKSAGLNASLPAAVPDSLPALLAHAVALLFDADTSLLYLLPLVLLCFFAASYVYHVRRHQQPREEHQPAGLPAAEPAMHIELSSEILGYGSHGTVVFKGTHHGRDVAVKRILSTFYDVAEHEVQLLLAADEHPNVVRYYAQERDEQFVYLAIGLCRRSIEQFVADGAYEPSSPDTLTLVHELVSGVAHLHKLNIVHRDLKPQNVLLDAANRVKLSDMGLAKKLEFEQGSFSSAGSSGTCGWQSPEQLVRADILKSSRSDASLPTAATIAAANLSESNLSPGARLSLKIDIWALGCLLYYILSKGEHPFGQSFEREANLRRGAPPRLERIGHDPVAVDLVSRMLAYNPKQRPTTAEVLAHPFFWSAYKRLLFIRDASDRLEIEKPLHPVVRRLEERAVAVVGLDWRPLLPAELTHDLNKFRKYQFNRIRDLARVVRNKFNHYRDLPASLQQQLGSLPDGFLGYFHQRWPLLFVTLYDVVRSSSLCFESAFAEYFPADAIQHREPPPPVRPPPGFDNVTPSSSSTTNTGSSRPSWRDRTETRSRPAVWSSHHSSSS